MTDGEEHPSKGQLDREAAEWCVRMHGDEPEQWRPQFDDWVKRGALHLRAYNRIEEVYLLGGRLGRGGGDASAGGTPSRPLPRTRMVVAAVVLAILIVAASVLGWSALVGGPSSETLTAEATLPQQLRLTTPPGRSQRLALRDGSIVTIAGASSIVVAFDARTRRLDLLAGSARFDVAASQRPFVVWAGGGSVTALGTRFDVDIDSAQRVNVRLIEGRVAIRPPADAGMKPRLAMLKAGQQRSYAAANSQVLREVEPDRPQPATVGELIDLANARPGVGPRIEIVPMALRDIRLGGRFQVRDPISVAEHLAIMFDLRIDRTNPQVILITR